MPGTTSNSIIDHAVEFCGDIRLKGSLKIDGHILGNVFSAKDAETQVTIGQSGSFEGEVHAANIEIKGAIKGNIFARNSVTIRSTAKIYGVIHYGSISIDGGALLECQLMEWDDSSIAIKQLEKTDSPPSKQTPTTIDVR